MELHEYPRPKDDTGIGVHWSAGYPLVVGIERVRSYWLPELQAMGVKWVKIANHDGGLELAELLLANDIMPIVRIYRAEPNPGTLGERELQAVRDYVSIGVRYFEFNNEPELGVEWVGGVVPPNALDIVAQNAIIDMERILERGGYPAIPALATGSRWDIVGKIVELGRIDLFQGPVWQAVHNYSVNHPIDYPDDDGNQRGAPYTPEFFERIRSERWGRDAWNGRSLDEVNRLRRERANPGHTIMDDASCWRSYEFFDALVRKHIGRSIPVLSTENGWLVGEDADPRYPATTPNLHMAQTLEACRIMMGTSERYPPAPDYYFCTAFWLLGNYTLGHWAARWESQAWYSSMWPGGRLPIVDALKAEPKQPRRWHGGSAVGGVLQGKVRAGAGRRLILENEQWRAVSVVGPDETYRFTGVPMGSYVLRVDGTEISRPVRILDAAEPVVLDLDLSAVIVRPRRSVVRGVVRNGAGRTVILRRDGWEDRTEAGSDGSYRFEGLPEGVYELSIEGTTVRRAGIELDGERTVTVDLTVPGWGYVVRDMGMGPGFSVVRCSVEGRLRLPVRIWTHGWPGISGLTGTKTEYGPFACEFAPLGAGDYTIEPEGLGIRATIHVPAGRALMVIFSEAEEETPAPSPPSQSVIQGQIVGGAGREVLLTWSDGERRVTADDLGRYRFEGLPAGVYAVRVEGTDQARSGIVLDGANQVTVDFSLASPPQQVSVIRGRIVNGAGRQVRLEGPGGPYTVNADARGRYRFEGLGAGTYRLVIPGTDVVRDGIAVDGRNEAVVDLTIPEAAWVATVRDGGPGPGFAVVRCSVEGKPGLPVRLWTEGWAGVVQRAGSKTEYGPYAMEFAPLGPGRYYVEPQGLGVRATIELPPGRVIWVEFAPASQALPGTVRGRVTRGAGRQVRLEGEPGSYQATVGPDETFLFEDVAPGAYRLRVVGSEIDQVVRVEPGQTVELTIELPAQAPPKLIDHFVLVGELAATAIVLVAAMRYAARFRAAVGMEVDQAQQARHVTILGDERAVPESVAQSLRQAGCEVDRIRPPYVAELIARVEAGRPW